MPTFVHVVAGVAGPALGLAALHFPHGVPVHRALGKAYLGAWLVIGATGFALGADTPVVSPFEALTAAGLLCVAPAYGAVLLRRRIGRRWLRRHHTWMPASLAALLVTALNQTILQTVGMYPRRLFRALVLSPFVVLPTLHRRLDRRYGFASAKTSAQKPVK